MMGGQVLSYTTPKTRIGRLVNGWIEWSENAGPRCQSTSVASSFLSRARSVSSSHPGSSDEGHFMDWQGLDTETTPVPTLANGARAEDEREASRLVMSSLPVQDMEFTRERFASIQPSVPATPSIVPDPDYHDNPSPAKKTFGLFKERSVSLSGALITPAQPIITPPSYAKTRRHTEMVEKGLTFSERSVANFLAGGGRSVSGPAQSYFSMMQRAPRDSFSRNANGFDNRPPPAALVAVDMESIATPDDEILSTFGDD